MLATGLIGHFVGIQGRWFHFACPRAILGQRIPRIFPHESKVQLHLKSFAVDETVILVGDHPR